MATQAAFLAFLRSPALIPVDALPDDSPYITAAYDYAVALVLQEFISVSPSLYDLAVYNLGTDFLLNWCPDTPPSTYFTDVRKTMDLAGFVAGPVTSTSDEGTSSSFTIADFFKGLQMSDLQNLRTPYGRMYLSIAQKAGPNLFGVS